METTDKYEHSLSAETIGYNVDILTEILLRLPAKSLVRFKCISKLWLSLISHSKFCNDHTRKNVNPTVSGLYIDSHPLISFKTKTRNGQRSLPKLDFLPKSLHKEFRIVHSCNGLILCYCGPEFIVCNPTVQKFKLVPSDKDRMSRKFLSFNPTKSPYFKVVSLVFKWSSVCSYDIDIFSSESGMWETIDDLESEFDPIPHFVLCDGALYWMTKGDNVMRFDIDAKSLTTHQTFLGPIIFNHKVQYFGGYGQYLTLVLSNFLNTPTGIQILEMDTRNFRWILKHDLDFGPRARTDTSFGESNRVIVKVLYLKGGDEEETPTLLFAACGLIVLYNPTSMLREFIPQDVSLDIEKMMFKQSLYAAEFIESLALI